MPTIWLSLPVAREMAQQIDEMAGLADQAAAARSRCWVQCSGGIAPALTV